MYSQVDTSAAIRRCAFTLAEVLITLGIIGIVAAMTMPSLIYNHNKKVVEARLQKVHSVMNQAISMAELNYGPRDTWFINNSGYDAKKSWCEKYLIPYLKVVKSGKYDNSNKFYMTFVDGSSLMTAENNFFDWLFFPGNIDNCAGNKTDNYGVCFFPFRYRPVKIPSGDYDAWNFETYAASWNGSTDALKTDSNYGCYSGSKYHGYCTRLIQVNGWKFPKDYPYRVKYR